MKSIYVQTLERMWQQLINFNLEFDTGFIEDVRV
jgi:hypothetical protein